MISAGGDLATGELGDVAAQLAAARPEDVFGALAGARAEQVAQLRQQYRRLAVAVHPDRHGNDPRANAAFVALQRLYSTALELIAQARYGQQAWMNHLAEQARSLYGRLGRPERERFAPAQSGHLGYDMDDVDVLCQRLTAYFDHGEPLTAHEIRSATFRRRHGAKGYAEGPVDAFCARAIEVLLGVE